MSVLIEIPDSGDAKNIAQFSVFVRLGVNEGFQLVTVLLATSSLHVFHFVHHIKNFEGTEIRREQEIKKEENT